MELALTAAPSRLMAPVTHRRTIDGHPLTQSVGRKPNVACRAASYLTPSAAMAKVHIHRDKVGREYFCTDEHVAASPIGAVVAIILGTFVSSLATRAGFGTLLLLSGLALGAAVLAIVLRPTRQK
jgi:hypothetical protein